MTSVSYRHFTGSGAENYERWFVPAIAAPVSAALLEAADPQPGERLLDVACGTGLVARLAAGKVGPAGAVTGVDIAPDMIEVARRVPNPAGVPIEWRVGDATALDVPDGSYDVVLCQIGLMFMEDVPAAVAEMRRVLAPGGRLVVNTPGRIHPIFEAMEEAIVEHIAPELGRFVRAVFSMHDPEAVAALLRDAGLAGVSGSEYVVAFHLPPPAEFLWQYINLTPMGPLVARAPEAAHAAMERQVTARWQPYVVDGATVIQQRVVLATGRR